MSFFQCFIYLLFLVLPGGDATVKGIKVIYNTIFVDPSGNGTFKTIQSAIDSIPQYNKQWIRIQLKAGIYREKVRIPFEKSFIYIQGEGMKKTVVVWNDHGSIQDSVTFTSQGDNIIVKNITFINSYNYPATGSHGNPMGPAPAARIQGDKSSFYGCGFMGLQDTLWDDKGRHYFKNCIFHGAVDFIFGGAQSLYKQCTISVDAGVLKSPGYITAHSRTYPNETSGFVLNDCNIIGNGKAFLGRAWRGYARVVFYNTSMSDIIVPQGWDAWFYTGHENQITFEEYNCHGLGSNTSRRVKWANKLRQSELDKLINISFIDSEGWITKQGFN